MTLPRGRLAPAVPRPAATVAILRHGGDEDGRPEVLLTHRPPTMAFGPGLHVFPGGALDPGDADPDLLARVVPPLAGDPGGVHGLPFVVAAIREAWEEAGILLATGPGADDFPSAPDAARTDRSFGALVVERDVVLRGDLLVPNARWVTPAAVPRRYDARFFVAWLPDGVTPLFDPHEVIGHDWLAPAAALEAMTAGRMQLWMPTSTMLQRLAGVRGPADLVALAARGPAAAPVLTVDVPGVRRLTLSGAGAVPGTPGTAWIVGERRVVIVDPGDPSEEAIGAIHAIVAAMGAEIVAVALTSADPERAAGAEHLALDVGAPVHASAAAARLLACEVEVVAPGGLIGDGDQALRVLPGTDARAETLAYGVGETGLVLGGGPPTG